MAVTITRIRSEVAPGRGKPLPNDEWDWSIDPGDTVTFHDLVPRERILVETSDGGVFVAGRADDDGMLVWEYGPQAVRHA